MDNDFEDDLRQEERESHARLNAEIAWCDEHAANFSALTKDAYTAYVDAENLNGHVQDSDGFTDARNIYALAGKFRALAEECNKLAQAMEVEA